MYSLPIHGNACFKIGFDAGGNRVDPDKRNFIPDRKREEAISDYCKKLTPEVCIPLDHHIINTLRSNQMYCLFADDIFKFVFFKESCRVQLINSQMGALTRIDMIWLMAV